MKLSKEKRDRISEQILSYLYHNFPKSMFTAEIAREIARDEEFVKALMLELKNKNLVISVRKNPDGIPYVRRIRWRLSNQAKQAYTEAQ
jgi:DNA-binding IscR family transcriptional regulator